MPGSQLQLLTMPQLSRPLGCGKRPGPADATGWLATRVRGRHAAPDDVQQTPSSTRRMYIRRTAPQRVWLEEPTLPCARPVDTMYRTVRSQGSGGIVEKTISVPRQAYRDFGKYVRRVIRPVTCEVLPVGADLFAYPGHQQQQQGSGSRQSTPIKAFSRSSSSGSQSTPIKAISSSISSAVAVAETVRPEWAEKAVTGALCNDIFWTPVAF